MQQISYAFTYQQLKTNMYYIVDTFNIKASTVVKSSMLQVMKLQ